MSGTKHLKPLVITTSHGQAAGSEYAWNKLQAPDMFISGIVTPDVNIESSEELNRLISGIPTPFARPAMFKYAISYVAQAGEDLRGLLAFYKTLQDEWKGLVACLALDNQPITVEKVRLEYSDGRDKGETTNMYEPKGAFGNMLFDDAELWCDQHEQTDTTKRAKPFLYIIRYNGLVIGGTAPEALLFTAPSYDINTKKGFYSQITKKFTDPLRANLTHEEVEKLYAYVAHIVRSMDDYKSHFTKRKPSVSKVEVFLTRWMTDIEAYATRKGFDFDKKAIAPNLKKFSAPFDRLFNFQTTLYGWGGRISGDQSTLQLSDGVSPVEVELAELLLNPDTSTVAEIIFNDDAEAASAGVHLLKVPSDKGDKYFSIPLSEKGLAIFQDNLGGLLQSGGDIRSYMSGIFDMASKSLQVTLQVDVNGNATSFTKSFKEPVRIEGQRILCWPNFVSKIWKQYYLYSELPHNGPELKAYPLRADKVGFNLLVDEQPGAYRFRKIAVNGKKVAEEDQAAIVVEYDINKVGTTDLKYEIYESAEPFKGVELQFKNKCSGYVVFRSLTSGDRNTLKDLRNRSRNLTGVRVGFDFGSNNICISYAEAGQDPKLVEFKNRRLGLLGSDVANNTKVSATPSEVFFFQNEETASNLIKSMIMTHDECRVPGVDVDPSIALAAAIKGGFPVFERNIPVVEATDSTYTVQFTNQPSYIKFNMKWSHDKKENAYKEGLLKVLWLCTYAELLELERYPESLVWAYPSAMSSPTRTHYQQLWLAVGTLNPLEATEREYGNAKVATLGARSRSPLELQAQTEAASVCKHALDVGFQADQRGLIIGFDVGGSTTDILCIAQKKDRTSDRPDDFSETLIKEGSIRLAAGRLADATRKSPKFQDVLRSFCRKRTLSIHGITVPPDRLNGNTASYYYNQIVDRLNAEGQLADFYRSIAADCPELFTLNAFMTGLIMFYAGQLASRIRQTQEENPGDYFGTFTDVMIGCFGKGGRMFDWLPAVNEAAALDYFEACFFSGYGPQARQHKIGLQIRPTSAKHVKAEVSFGLAASRVIKTTPEPIAELIGEEGYTYNGAPIEELAPVEGRFLQHFGNQFATPQEFKRFGDFAQIFRQFTREYFGVNMPTLDQDLRGMRLKAYIDNIPDYRLARKALETLRAQGGGEDQSKFDFEAPIIILEGMCFLDTVLSPKLFGQ